MENLRATGLVRGPYSEEKLVCQYSEAMVNSKGVFIGDDPFNFSVPMVLAQSTLMLFISRMMHCLLKPLGQGALSAQIIAGIIMGPSVLGQSEAYVKRLFPAGAKIMADIFANSGFIFHLFLLGLQMNPRIIRRAGKRAFLIGVVGFVLPYGLGELAFIITDNLLSLDAQLSNSINFIVALNSMSSFVVITSLLNDLNILNSELGRLATQTSMVSDFCSWFLGTIGSIIDIATNESDRISLWSVISILIFFSGIVFVLRPLTIWISKRNPHGEQKDELLFFAIIVMIHFCALCSDALGQHAALGPLILGMALPDGPPIGPILLGKFETMVNGLQLPIFFALSGSKAQLSTIGIGMFPFMVQFIILMGYVGKFVGTLIPAIFSGIPAGDSLCLAMIMCCKGIIDIAAYSFLKDTEIISYQSYTLLIINMLIVTGVCRPMVQYLYDPATSFVSYSRKFRIFPKHDDSELRILVGIHNGDNVPGIITLLEASNPTKTSPISVYALCLMELVGSSSSVLESYDPRSRKKQLKSGGCAHQLEPIINALNHYQDQRAGVVRVQHYTAVAPYSSMHTDVCSMAAEMRTNIIILPFHKQQMGLGFGGETDGTAGSCVKTVNVNVMEKAPCSVGILVDRGGGNSRVKQRSFVEGTGTTTTTTTSSSSLYHTAMLFLGGADDREALSFCTRMAEHPRIRLTVVWFRSCTDQELGKSSASISSISSCTSSSGRECYLDKKMMNELFKDNMGVGRFDYREEIIKDGEGTVEVIRCMEEEGSVDLIVTGRHHDDDHSPFTSGLSEWHRCPVLGLIGDLLADPEFHFSVLVVQQQPFGLCLQDLMITTTLINLQHQYQHQHQHQHCTSTTTTTTNHHQHIHDPKLGGS